MRKKSSGLRIVGWGVLIIVVVAAAAGVIGYQFKLIGDQRTYVDANSGDLAKDRTILGYIISRKVDTTKFSDTARQMGLVKANPDWQQIMQFSWLSGTKTDYPMNGADAACIGAMWKVRNEPTDADKKKLLSKYLALLQAHDVKGMIALSKVTDLQQQERVKNQPQRIIKD